MRNVLYRVTFVTSDLNSFRFFRRYRDSLNFINKLDYKFIRIDKLVNHKVVCCKKTIIN